MEIILKFDLPYIACDSLYRQKQLCAFLPDGDSGKREHQRGGSLHFCVECTITGSVIYGGSCVCSSHTTAA